jgi:hypothetical protein
MTACGWIGDLQPMAITPSRKHSRVQRASRPFAAGGSLTPLPAYAMCAALTAGAVAQLGERLVRNEEVVGSIPISSTSPSPPQPTIS